MKNLFLFVLAVFMLSACHSLKHSSYTPAKLAGNYSRTIVQEGIDIPDYVRQTTIKLKEDLSFEFESIESGLPDNTISGRWSTSNDTLILEKLKIENSDVAFTMRYKIESTKILRELPVGKSDIPFKRWDEL
jgi:hypothetical protein